MKANWKRCMAAVLAGFGLAGTTVAATYTSKASGNYNADATWNEGGNPGVGATSDTVTINAPHTATVVSVFCATNDVVIVNPGAVLRNMPGAAYGKFYFGGAQIQLRGGTLSADVREWEGSQPGCRIMVVSNSVIDTFDSYTYPTTLGHEIYDSLTVLPAVTKVTFINSWWNTSPFEVASCAFANSFTLSNSVEFCTDTPKAYVELNNIAINAGVVLTKTGSGRLQIKGTPNSRGTIVVNEGSLEPLVPGCLGTNEVTINPGATFSLPYMSGSSVSLLGLPISLNGGVLDYGYVSWAQTVRGALTVKSNSTLNIYNLHSTLNGTLNSFDTLAFGADPSGAGYELHCTQFGGHPSWSNTVIGSKFAYSCTFSNSAVINADPYAALWFDKALVLTAGKTLTKKGEGVMTLNGVFTNAGTLAVEGGPVTVVGAMTVNGASVVIANNSTGGVTLVALSGGVRGSGDLVLNNNSAVATGIVVSAAGVTNWGRIVNSGTGSGSVLISSVIGTNGTGVLQDSASSPLILSGANVFTSGTVVAAGRLVVSNAVGSATGPGAVTIRNGAILQGAGTVAGAVTNQHGGSLRPGVDGVAGGTLSVGNLTWNGGGAIAFDVASLANNEAGAGLDYDQIVVTNSLAAVPGGSNLVVRLDSLGQALAFETNRNYILKLISCGKTATLNPADVTLDTNAFLAGGTWAVTNLNNALYVVCLGAPASPTRNYWRGTGNWSTATNWSLGHAPLPGEDVEFDLIGAANCSADSVSNDLGSLTLAAGYTGTVVLLVRYPGQGAFTNLSIAGECSIMGGNLSHLANTTGDIYRVMLTVGGNLSVGPAGKIDVEGMGCSAMNGPGRQIMGTCSGSYGGKGYPYDYNGVHFPGPSYGSITAPINNGSGGNNTAGGGAIQLVVGGTATVNGAISAGGNSNNLYYTGSGGSVFLTTGYLAGEGTIRANGAHAGHSRSGGGGRVAVILTQSTDFGSVKMQAYGGISPAAGYTGYAGTGGTVYREHTGHAKDKGSLTVDYGLIRVGDPINNTAQNGSAGSSYAFSEIVITNGAVYLLDTNDALDIVSTALKGDPANRNEGIYVAGGTLTVPAAFSISNLFIAVGATNSTFNPASSLTVGTNGTVKFDVPWTANCPVTLLPGGWMSHSPNGITLAGEKYKIDLTVNGDLDIQPGSQINVDGMGYIANSGPGAGNCASHGGQGSKYGAAHIVGPTYGSITTPTNCGSGGGVSGGGAVRLRVTGTTTVNGLVSANGTTVDHYGGAGGSIFLTTGILQGGGTLQANGSRMTVSSAASSGGGRISVVLTNDVDFGPVAMEAFAGVGGNKPGAAGTIYRETAAQGPGQGTLVIDASNIVSVSADAMIPMTVISSQVTDTVVGSVIITNKAILVVNTNQLLTVNGSWTNAAAFFARTNSTVTFAGDSAVTIAGSNAFYNLAITNANKIVSFQAGKTNTVAGLLKLGSTVSGSTVTLQSTVDGSWWFVKLTTNPGGTQDIARVTVKDSNASGGQLLVAARGSISGGHNVNWFIPSMAGTVIVVR